SLPLRQRRGGGKDKPEETISVPSAGGSPAGRLLFGNGESGCKKNYSGHSRRAGLGARGGNGRSAGAGRDRHSGRPGHSRNGVCLGPAHKGEMRTKVQGVAGPAPEPKSRERAL